MTAHLLFTWSAVFWACAAWHGAVAAELPVAGDMRDHAAPGVLSASAAPHPPAVAAEAPPSPEPDMPEIEDDEEDKPPGWSEKLKAAPRKLWRALLGKPDEGPPPAHEGLDALPPLYPYRVRFVGLPRTEDVGVQMRRTSALYAAQARGSVPPRLLEKRALEETPALLQALRAEGYYGAVLNVRVTPPAREGAPAMLVYKTEPGARFRVAAERVELKGPHAEGFTLPNPERMTASAKNKPARSAELMSAAAFLQKELAERNHLLSCEVTVSVTLNPLDHTVTAVYEAVVGPQVVFGPLTTNGLVSVKPRVIKAMIPWKEGDPFSPALLQKARENLLKSGLFATAELTPSLSADTEGRAPLTLNVKEAYHRTVKAGASYMTDAGPGAAFSWEHRNYDGGGEKLTAGAEISGLKTAANGSYTAPYFRGTRGALTLTAALAQETPEAYTSQSVDAGVTLERSFTPALRAGAGGAFRLSHVENPQQGNEDYALLYWPLYAAYDSRDNPADPSRGTSWRVDAAPYTDTLQAGKGFFRWTAAGSVYLPLVPLLCPAADPHEGACFADRAAPLLAMRGLIGSVMGASTGDVPADTRLYAGGGASVRGYGYRELSPMKGNEPIGGKSLMEVSAELRFRFSEEIGGAVFLEGGDAFEDEYPDLSQGLHWGAGTGLRYYTPAGPLRLDVAVPLNRRETDPAFSLYVSLGQAF